MFVFDRAFRLCSRAGRLFVFLLKSKDNMLKNIYKGKFIVFEGQDGSGQSTQAKLSKEYLESKNYFVVLTKEPTLDSEAGIKIREILDEKTKSDPADLQKLFSQDRKEHLDNLIISALKENKIVISDRYFFSSFAFGSIDLDLDWLIEINNEFLIPDMTFILDVKPEICIERINKRGKKVTLFEKIEKLKKVRENYKKFPSMFENVYLIDGEKSIPEVFEQIKKILDEKLN
ncbi:MAG: dTMP kinase [Parcubacteria group bacterium Athens0714_24]|nr:MAG: dTMP kinase [Parcubacteria group bacterium Athens0714_24]